MSNQRWWLYINQEVSEQPYTRQELSDMELKPEFLVCPDGSSEWRRLETVDSLAKLLEDSSNRFPPLTMPEAYQDMEQQDEGGESPDTIHEQGLFISEIKETDDSLEVTFNDRITIRNVRIHEGEIEWPREKADSDFPLVRFDRERYEQAVQTAIIEGTIRAHSEEPTVTIARSNAYSSGQLVGFFDVDLQGVLTITGFQLMESNDDDGYWVSLPSINQDDEWIDQVTMDGKLKQKLAEMAREEIVS